MIPKVRIGIALAAFCTLVLELSLVRVYDVILTPNMGYAVITATVFALGLGGIALYVFPLNRERALGILPYLFLLFTAFTLLLRPLLNWLPFELNFGGTGLTVQIISWVVMYLALIAPFFVAGLIISIILTHFAERVHALYFFDLVGAGLGCALIIPLITPYGPGGIQFVVAGVSLLAAVLFLSGLLTRILLIVFALGLCIYPYTQDDYLEYDGHANKRGVDDWKRQGLRDYIRWDPVSKLEVFGSSINAYNFALDGGQQGSWLQNFGGNYEELRQAVETQPDTFYYGMNSVVHYLMYGRQPEVLIIGAAVGGETKAALVFGAKHIDAIELVGEMVDAAKTRYNDYGGKVFTHPSVNYRVGEGRTFLRASEKKYDIIQMFSNHTSSSIADGSGAVAAAYLQTAEAYTEYFTHLSDDGIMQINHHLYPRMLTTAALAWQRLGRENFSKHVLVMERWVPDTLPTMLIKMKPWTQEEVEQVYGYMNHEFPKIWQPNQLRGPHWITRDKPFVYPVVAREGTLENISFYVKSKTPQAQSADIKIDVLDESESILSSTMIGGDEVKDLALITATLDPPLAGVRNQKLKLRFGSDNTDQNYAYSVGIGANNKPMIDMRAKPAAFLIAFNPLDPDANLIPGEFLNKPFNSEWLDGSSHDFTPVTDNNPYFSMIRLHGGRVSGANSPYMDGGTERFLNLSILPFLSADWLALFIVGSISLVFSLIFIYVPLLFSRHGRARWRGMGSYLVYFSCLGAGFIIIELVLVQIFKKLIGYPIHTYITVIFSLLISAGLGSLCSKYFNLIDSGRWRWLFALILVSGVIFTLTYAQVFHVFLAHDLPTRIAIAVLMLLPLGFLMGMPLPMAIYKMGLVAPNGIPWAWGMNGFFTVFGGFLSVVLSVLLGFKIVLLIGFAIYALAFFTFARIQKLSYGF